MKAIAQDNKVLAIKIIRNETDWGLKDTKDWLEKESGYYEYWGGGYTRGSKIWRDLGLE